MTISWFKAIGSAQGTPVEASLSNPMPVQSAINIVDCTLSADTAILASGDIIADTQVLSTSAMRQIDGTGKIISVAVFDEDDQGTAIDLLFFDALVSLGTENSAPSVTDANMRNFLGSVSVAAADFIDYGGVRTAFKADLCIPVKAGSGVQTLWVAAICRSGTPTYTASGIKLRVGISA